MSTLRRIKQLQHRDDVLPDGHAPKATQLALGQIGGLNPYNEPKYRLVLAQMVYEWHGGEFIDWPKNASLQEQGGLVFTGTEKRTTRIELPDRNIPAFARRLALRGDVPVLTPSTTHPVRRFVGMRWVKRYPTIKGWVLQLWRPAQHFGSRKLWESFLYQGNPAILMLGPYPERGAYEIAGERIETNAAGKEIVYDSWEEVPPISLLEDMIQFLECDRLKTHGASPEARVGLRLAEYHRRLKAQEEKDREEQLQFIRDTMKPIMGSSLAAGRMRVELGKKAGITEHVGN